MRGQVGRQVVRQVGRSVGRYRRQVTGRDLGGWEGWAGSVGCGMGSLLAGWLAVRYRLASLQWTLCTCSFSIPGCSSSKGRAMEKHWCEPSDSTDKHQAWNSGPFTGGTSSGLHFDIALFQECPDQGCASGGAHAELSPTNLSQCMLGTCRHTIFRQLPLLLALLVKGS